MSFSNFPNSPTGSTVWIGDNASSVRETGSSKFVYNKSMESTAVTPQLNRSINMFNGTDVVIQQRTLHAMANLVHSKISEILDRQLHHPRLYRKRSGRGRSVTRG